MITRRARGFPNQKALHIPEAVIESSRKHALLTDLMPVYSGFFPKALGHEMRRSAIPEWIVIYCSEGRGWYESKGTRWNVESGDVLFCWKGEAHAYGSDDHKPWSIHWTHFIGKRVPAYLKLIGASPDNPVVRVKNGPQMIRLFGDVHETIQAGYSLHHMLHASACFQQILSTSALARMYSKPEQVGDVNIEKVIAFMRASLAGFLTLNSVARHVHMSPSHFSRKFRSRTGYAPIEYFHRLKMQRACEILDTTDNAIAEVGLELGYEDPYYFSRAFRKIIGRSPRMYRKLRRA